MSRVFQPVGQVRLTNVAIVRLKSHGRRFEVACYCNKILSYRAGVEKDVDEVLQVKMVFTNVGKGQYAKKEDLIAIFGTAKEEEVCKLILDKGEVQVTDKERHHVQESLLRDICCIVAEKCINLKTGLSITVSAAESALKQIGFSVKVTESAKKQSLKAIKDLLKKMPDFIARTQMRLQISCCASFRVRVTDILDTLEAVIETETGTGETVSQDPYVVTFLCDPSTFRKLDRVVHKEFSPEGALRLLSSSASLAARQPDDQASEVVLEQQEAFQQNKSGSEQASEIISEKPEAPPCQQSEYGGAKAIKCSSCAYVCGETSEYRSHCKSEWHGFNLKLKFKEELPITEEQFKDLNMDIKKGFLAVDA